jgi:hypothetical protein
VVLILLANPDIDAMAGQVAEIFARSPKRKIVGARSLLPIAALVMQMVGAISTQAQAVAEIQWQQSFGGADYDELTSVQQTRDGGYILGGDSFSGISGNKTSISYGSSDYWVIKLDGSGHKVWEQSFGGANDERLSCVQQTSDGGYILGGYSKSGVSGNKTSTNHSYYDSYDYWVIKLDGGGNKVWENSFGGTDFEILLSLQQTTDGGYILGGFSNSDVSGSKTSTNYGGNDYWVIKLDAGGNEVWEKSFGGTNDDGLYSLQQTSDGGYILGGFSNSDVSGNKTSTNYGNYDYWVIKLDEGGNKVWEKSFGGTDIDVLQSLQQTSDGGYILGGWSMSGVSGSKTSTNYGGYDYWVIKLDASGNKLWEKSFGGSGADYLLTLQQTTDGGYILGGESNSGVSGNKNSANQGSYDFWVVKLDASGNKVWDQSFGGSDWEILYSASQTSDGGYILCGNSSSEVSGNKTSPHYGDRDYWVVKLSPPRPVMSIVRTSENVTLTWTAVPRITYRVQYKSNLNDASWTELPPPVTASGDSASTCDPIGTNTSRYYRIIVP